MTTTSSRSPSGARGRRRSPVPDRVVELIRVPAGELVANPRNWRRHPQRQRAALRGILREIGYADALLARRHGDDLVLIDGHLRQSLDPDQVVPVLVLDVSAAEADTLLATLDPLAGLAQADGGALAELLGRVQTSSRAVQDLLHELARGVGLPVRPLLVDPDDAPPAPAVPSARPGDLWELGEHRLLCGDATRAEDLERLMGGQEVDLLWTDPPYGVSYQGKSPRRLRITGDVPGAAVEVVRGAFARAAAALRPGAALYVAHPAGPGQVAFLQAFGEQGWRLRQTLVWVKDTIVLGRSDYHYQHEPIAYGHVPGPGRWGRGGPGWYGGNAQSSVLHVPKPPASRDHPTMKPVELVRRCLVNSSQEGERVLDPFCGSGTTLIAAQLTGRRASCMELDPRYCDVVVARFERATGIRARRLRA